MLLKNLFSRVAAVSLLLVVAVLVSVCSGSGSTSSTVPVHAPSASLPIVIWHGMGDTCCDPKSLGKIIGAIEDTLPGTYVHSIRIGGVGGSADQDRRASFFGNANDQVAEVCAELARNERLRGGFHAIGFSQGGQLLRAYVERCNSPRVHTLITFGSQHAGVADIPNCSNDLNNGDGKGVDMNSGDEMNAETEKSGGLLCSAMRAIVRRGAYAASVQPRIIQAQYYKDPKQLGAYLEHSLFLADINNEREVKNRTYATNLASLQKLVLVQFTEDRMVFPKESAWFGFVAVDGDGDNDSDILKAVPLEEQPLYKEDWIGLRQLMEQGRVDFKELRGGHMSISLDFFIHEILEVYCRGSAAGGGDAHDATLPSRLLLNNNNNDNNIHRNPRKQQPRPRRLLFQERDE